MAVLAAILGISSGFRGGTCKILHSRGRVLCKILQGSFISMIFMIMIMMLCKILQFSESLVHGTLGEPRFTGHEAHGVGSVLLTVKRD